MDYKSSLENFDQNMTSISSEISIASNYTEIKDVDSQLPVVTATESNDNSIESLSFIAPYMLPQKIAVKKYRLKK